MCHESVTSAAAPVEAGGCAGAAGPYSDLTYAMSCSSCSSDTRPWNGGMTGWNPATTFACGLTIDSRM